MTLWNRKKMLVLKNCFGPIFSPRLTPPYSQAPSSPRCSSTILCEMRPSVPNAKSSLPLLASSSVILEQVSWHLLPSGVNGYHRVILLPGNSFYLEQVAAQCLFPPRFGYLSSHCLSACRERRRTTCREDVLWIHGDPSVTWAVLFPRDSLAQRLYQHPGLFLSSHPCEAYQGTGSHTCHKHIFQHLPSFSAVSYILGYQYRPFFTPWSAASSLSDTHISTHISSRPAAVFLLLQLRAYLTHGVFS